MMQIKFTAEDFDNLWDASMKWGNDWKAKSVRFESGISFHWKYAYWFQMSYANLILAREYLKSIGESFEITSDEAGGWIILTDYFKAWA